jgi:hypothetical protein
MHENTVFELAMLVRTNKGSRCTFYDSITLIGYGHVCDEHNEIPVSKAS